MCKLLKPALRIKIGTLFCCSQFSMLQFLTEDEWKTVGEFEAIIRDTSRLTSVFQNEEKLNGARGPVMRKSLHDSLSRGTMRVFNADHWSSNKDMMHPTQSGVNIISFTKAGKTCKRRALLECERGFLIENRSTLLLKIILIFA